MISPDLRRSQSVRNSAVSPVSFPRYGPRARSRTTPVANEINATSRTSGNPNPIPWAFDCGNALWFAEVSGIEAVVPSTSVTRRPFQSHASEARPSVRRAVSWTRRTITPSGSRSRASQ
jgi:hypothetical protein